MPEVPHRGSLLRFCEADSNVLEKAFTARRDELERLWWEEEAAVQAGPKESKSKATTASTAADTTTAQPHASVDPPAPDCDSSSWNAYMIPDTGEAVGILVRSGTHEVDLARRVLSPCYWPSSRHRILRGTWFAEKSAGEWVPLREPLADQLEQAYVSRIWEESKGRLAPAPALVVGTSGEKGAPIPMAARLDLNTVVDSGLFALFVGQDEAYLLRESRVAWLARLGASGAAAPTKMRLRRGYVAPTSPAALAKEADLAAEAADDAAAAVEPTHLVLAVHGIGQTLERANIAEDAIVLRAGLRQMDREAATAAAAEKTAKSAAPSPFSSPQKPPRPSSAPSSSSLPTNEPSESPLRPPTRVEVLPVQWRKTLSLEVDALAAALRPPGIPSLRQVLHSTAVEVLLYLTPLHRASVLSGVVASLNSAYARFMLRNPNFRGPVSIIAHSLGSVLCWDILCNQPDAVAMAGGAPMAVPATGPSWSAAPVAIQQLAFDVDQLILAGSPLGCFLALRGVDPLTRPLGSAAAAPLMQCHPDFGVTPDGLPAVRRLYHIYHPYDAVAYRLEPLAYQSSELGRHRLALVPLHGGGGSKRLHIAAQELGDSVSSAASRLGSTIAGVMRLGSGRRRRRGGGGEGEGAATDAGDEEASPTAAAAVEGAPVPMELEGCEGEEGTAAASATASPAAPSSPPGSLPGPPPPTFIARVAGGELPAEGGWPSSATGRLDFPLQESSLESQYLAALSAHFTYWSSRDVAQFVWRAVCGNDVLSGKPAAGAAAGVVASGTAPPSRPGGSADPEWNPGAEAAVILGS